MSRDDSTAAIASNRRGFWIYCGVAGFTAGYPLLLFTLSEPNPLLLTATLVFGIAALLTGSGFGWARVLHILLCLGAVMFLLLGLLASLKFGIGLSDGTWPITLLVIFVPLAGYIVSVGLLCTAALKNWQANVRDARRQKALAARSSARQSLEAAAHSVALEVCPWCDALTVDPTQERCLACNRPG